MCTPSTASGTAIVACVMLLITIGIIAATVRWLMRGPAAAKPADCHPIELLEHAPNNYELASSISFILPLVGWLNRLEDSPRWAWLLGAKDNAQWWTPDAPLGWIFRVLNKVDWWLYRVFGVRIVYMDRAGFLAKCAVLDKPAYKQCASDNSAEGFRLMLDACEADHISATGRMMLNQLMNGWLDTRVAVDNYCRAHPEVTATPIKRPVIIIGCPRTASTFMHKLLAQDPKLRKPLFWELAIPSPPPDPATYATDARRSLVATGFRSFDAISPHFYTDVHKYHYFGVDEIEEDSVLVHYAGVLAMHGIAFAGDSAYARWQRDPRTKEAAYLVHKKVLQILSCKWEQPVQWLLKAPTIHSCFLEQLLKVYPDACLVVTHRQPVEVLPSWCARAREREGGRVRGGRESRRVRGGMGGRARAARARALIRARRRPLPCAAPAASNAGANSCSRPCARRCGGMAQSTGWQRPRRASSSSSSSGSRRRSRACGKPTARRCLTLNMLRSWPTRWRSSSGATRIFKCPSRRRRAARWRPSSRVAARATRTKSLAR